MNYRKKPVVIQAIKWNGSNKEEIKDFLGDSFIDFLREASDLTKSGVWVKTLEGDIVGSEGDWIIKGIKGEFYPCKPDIFEDSYEKVD